MEFCKITILLFLIQVTILCVDSAPTHANCFKDCSCSSKINNETLDNQEFIARPVSVADRVSSDKISKMPQLNKSSSGLKNDLNLVKTSSNPQSKRLESIGENSSGGQPSGSANPHTQENRPSAAPTANANQSNPEIPPNVFELPAEPVIPKKASTEQKNSADSAKKSKAETTSKTNVPNVSTDKDSHVKPMPSSSHTSTPKSTTPQPSSTSKAPTTQPKPVNDDQSKQKGKEHAKNVQQTTPTSNKNSDGQTTDSSKTAQSPKSNKNTPSSSQKPTQHKSTDPRKSQSQSSSSRPVQNQRNNNQDTHGQPSSSNPQQSRWQNAAVRAVEKDQIDKKNETPTPPQRTWSSLTQDEEYLASYSPEPVDQYDASVKLHHIVDWLTQQNKKN